MSRRKNASLVKINAIILVSGARRVVTSKTVLESGSIEFTLDNGMTIRRTPKAKIDIVSAV